MSDKTILVIDDDELIRKILDVKLKSLGYKVLLAENGEAGIDIFNKEKVDLILSDLSMPGKSGFDVLNEVKNKKNVVVIIMTAFANIKTAIKALELGAFDYLIKPFNMEEIPYILNKAFMFQDFINKKNKKPAETKDKFFEIIGVSEYAKRLRNDVERVLNSNNAVLITGPAGTGKKFLASVINNYLPKSSEMFYMNIDGMTKNSVISIFEKEQLDFSGKYSSFLFENFNLLDFSFQDYILKFCRENPNIKFICTVNKEVTKYNYTEFISDRLYNYINDNVILTEPLNTHKEDIPLFMEYFIRNANQKYNKDVKDVNKEALYFLLHYHWPDNIMELQSAIEKAVFLCKDELITPDLLYKNIVDYQELDVVIFNPYLSYKDAVQLAKDKIDKYYYDMALKNTNHNKTKAAKLLGISLRQFQYRCKALGIK